MSIADQITRLQNAKASIKTAIENYIDGEVPSNKKIDDFPAYIASVYSAGQNAGGGGTGEMGTCVSSTTVTVSSGGSISNISFGSGASCVVQESGTASNIIVSSGATLICSSGCTATVEVKDGANAQYHYRDENWYDCSSSITNDIVEGNTNITLVSDPTLQVIIADASDYYSVSNLNDSQYNGNYYPYNASAYKHETQNCYLAHVSGMYVLTTTLDFGEMAIENQVIAYNSNGYTSSYSSYEEQYPTVTLHQGNGAQWKISTDNSWRNSLDVASGWTRGTSSVVSVVFKTVAGLNTPANQTVTLLDKKNVVEVEYPYASIPSGQRFFVITGSQCTGQLDYYITSGYTPTFSLDNAPSGWSINQSGVITGTPSSDGTTTLTARITCLQFSNVSSYTREVSVVAGTGSLGVTVSSGSYAGDYVLQSGNPNDTTAVFYNSQEGYYIVYGYNGDWMGGQDRTSRWCITTNSNLNNLEWGELKVNDENHSLPDNPMIWNNTSFDGGNSTATFGFIVAESSSSSEAEQSSSSSSQGGGGGGGSVYVQGFSYSGLNGEYTQDGDHYTHNTGVETVYLHQVTSIVDMGTPVVTNGWQIATNMNHTSYDLDDENITWGIIAYVNASDFSGTHTWTCGTYGKSNPPYDLAGTETLAIS